MEALQRFRVGIKRRQHDYDLSMCLAGAAFGDVIDSQFLQSMVYIET